MTTPRWFPDELARAGPEHLDAEYVEGYDDKAGTDPTEDVALLRDLGLNATSTLVDLGAGTGTFALAVAPFCRRVVAVDVSAAMLNQLRAKAARMGTINIDYVRAGFLSYQHQGGTGGVRLHAKRAPPPARFLEGDRASTDRRHPAARRGAAPARPCLLLRAL